MITNIFIDSNRTLEDIDTYSASRQSLFSQMAHLISEKYGECSISCLMELYNKFLEKFGPTPWDYHPVFWRSVLKKIFKGSDINVAIKDIFSEYLNLYSINIKLHSDAIPFLCRQSRCKNLVLIANANEERLYKLISQYNLQKYFVTFAISGESPFQKPESFLFDYPLNQLSVKANECCMIGDNYYTDIYGARKLGIYTIHLSRGNDGTKCLGKPWFCPDAEARSLNELDFLLESQPSTDLSPTPLELQSDQYIIRDAIIMCGGRGKRMGKLTESSQKCLLNLGGVPILDYVVRTLAGVGCSRIFFVVDYRSEDVSNLIQDGSAYGIKAEYIKGNFGSTLEGVTRCLNTIGDAFYYVHGNIVYPPRLLETLWVRFCQTKASTLVLVDSNQNIKHARAYIDNCGWITEVDSTGLAQPDKGLLFMGLGLYKKNIFGEHIVGKIDGMTETAAKFAVQHKTKIASILYQGKWGHLETELDYNQYKQMTPAQVVGW